MSDSKADTAEAKINLLFDSYADGDISADEAKKQLKGLLVDAYNRGYNTGWVKANRNNDGKRFGAAAVQLRQMADNFDRFQQTRQEKVRG